jgi:hypothetical protein
MLLVTFHGGSAPGINNIQCYDTGTKALLSAQCLRKIDSSKLSELRGMVYENGYLYVANGAKNISNVVTFQQRSSGKFYHVDYVADFIDPTLSSKGHFETSIGHPFSLAFDASGFAYVSNQDTNTIARVAVSADFRTGTLPSGCQSTYLLGQQKNLCPSGDCVFLDGTFVASQQGNLHGVDVEATGVPAPYGGLAVHPATGKVENSVRDLAVADDMLFACDQPTQLIRIYALDGGGYLGASSPLPDKPTHLRVYNGGLYVSAGSGLYWSPLPGNSASPALPLQRVLTAPSANTIGGISFNPSDASAIVYVCFQLGTGAAVGGSIGAYTWSQGRSGTAPSLTNGAVFASSPENFQDTPEFVLYLPDTAT